MHSGPPGLLQIVTQRARCPQHATGSPFGWQEAQGTDIFNSFILGGRNLKELISSTRPSFQGRVVIQWGFYPPYLQCGLIQGHQQVFAGHLLDARSWDDCNKQAELVPSSWNDQSRG